MKELVPPPVVAFLQKKTKGGQCPETHTTVRGRTGNTVFCTLECGHQGEHKGFRKRWPNKENP